METASQMVYFFSFSIICRRVDHLFLFDNLAGCHTSNPDRLVYDYYVHTHIKFPSECSQYPLSRFLSSIIGLLSIPMGVC